MSQQAPSSCRNSFEYKEGELEVRNDEYPDICIAKITSRGEEYFEPYGEDDIYQPKKFLARKPSHALSELTVDANMITWDGPNDLSNPQNWSIKYKWLVTVVCTIMTINVYV